MTANPPPRSTVDRGIVIDELEGHDSCRVSVCKEAIVGVESKSFFCLHFGVRAIFGHMDVTLVEAGLIGVKG